MARTIELADGVYRIATDNYRLNTGLVLGLERALVVDTGAVPVRPPKFMMRFAASPDFRLS